jgi:hypothetical protein
MSAGHHDDYHVEPIPGLPAKLPEGEHILWQGSPDWRELAKHVFHVRLIAVYFVLLILWRAVVHYKAAGLLAAAISVAGLLPLAALGLGLLLGLARLSSKTTIYTLTNRRLVFRIGIALPTAINLPFAVVAAAAARFERNGFGDIVLTLAGGHRIAYSNFWPHVRPWRFSRPEPMLRMIPDAERVAELVGAALRGESPSPVVATRPMPTQSSPQPKIISWGDVQTT